MRKDIVAIALWAVFVTLIPEKYRVVGVLLGTAILAAFLTVHNRRLYEEEAKEAMKQAVEGLDVDETVKERLYNELVSFIRSKRRGTYVRIFRVEVQR